jgi:hypothetical protein
MTVAAADLFTAYLLIVIGFWLWFLVQSPSVMAVAPPHDTLASCSPPDHRPPEDGLEDDHDDREPDVDDEPSLAAPIPVTGHRSLLHRETKALTESASTSKVR